MELYAKIEGILFIKGEPVEISKLATMVSAGKDEVINALEILSQKLEGSGLSLVRNETEVALGTHPELGPFIETIRKEELSKDLSKATLETLTIILYKNGATRSEIDYIRGVNSSFILRNLLIRGLIEKDIDPHDSRKIIYKPTLETISYLGIQNIEALPDFNNLSTTLKSEMARGQEKEAVTEES